MKNRIRLDTLSDCEKFVRIVEDEDVPVLLSNGDAFLVSGKSLLGALASTEWNNLWCICEKDIYNKIKEFIY